VEHGGEADAGAEMLVIGTMAPPGASGAVRASYRVTRPAR